MSAIPTFLGVETALRGILAQQEALDVTGNNIANANTAGYTRQVVQLTPTTPYPGPGLSSPSIGGQIGAGVDVTAVTRARDQYLDVQYRAQNMNSGRYQALSNGLQQVDQTLAEPSSNGISTLFANFWSAWQNVANDPQSAASRQALVQSGTTLASGIQQLDAQLTTYESQNSDNETQNLNLLNDPTSGYLAQIASLNTQIKNAEALASNSGSPVAAPNTLLDSRDALIDKVTQLVNTNVTYNSDGTVTLSVGSGASPISLVDSSGAHSVTLAQLTTGSPAPMVSGTLQGLVDYGTKLQSYQTTLDSVAATLLNASSSPGVNYQQEQGYDLNGNAGVAFFTGTNASDIAVNAAIVSDPSKIAASSSATAPGDGSNAIAVSDLQGASGGADTQYQSLVTTIGSDAQSAQNASDAATTLLGSISNQRLSVSGVSLDEEMTNLLQYQRGFQASARALTALDDMINTLITQTGRVGL